MFCFYLYSGYFIKRGKIKQIFSHIEIYARFFYFLTYIALSFSRVGIILCTFVWRKQHFNNKKHQYIPLAGRKKTEIMFLKKISIIGFKNIRETALELSPGINCFIGHNGVGKTNILDAVYYLSFCKSSSCTVDSQVINHDADFCVLEGCYGGEADEEENIYCGMKRGVKKRFRRNKKDYKRLSEHIGLIPLIMVSPSDTYLIEGASEERRRLMDVVISQTDPTYLAALNRYNKALQQRNTLLKLDDEPDPMLLDIWEEQMAAEGELIFRKRTEFVERLVPQFQQYYSFISGGREEVSLRYISHCQRGALIDVIRRDRFKDRAVGYSLHGVHRDDLEMLLGGYPMRREGSQGQNKTFVVSLKLAQFGFLRDAVSATKPILLLDDVFDKLDADRVEKIVHLVSGDNFGQIFLTDTNRDHLDSILQSCDSPYRIFTVEDGEVVLN